jgi:hypothetical protein
MGTVFLILNSNPAKSWLKTTGLRFDKLRLGTQFMVPEGPFMAVDDSSWGHTLKIRYEDDG